MKNTILLQRLVEHAAEKDGEELQKLVESLGIEVPDFLEEQKKGSKDDDYEGDDEEGEEDSEEEMQESLNRLLTTLDESADQDFKKIVQEQGFSSQFLTKTEALMESALNARKKAQEQSLEEKYEALAESYINEQVLPAIDDYLSYVAETYIRENEETISGNAKVSIAENLLSGLRDLFEENNIEVPEGKTDVVEEQEEELRRIRKELNEELQKSKQLTESLNTEKRKGLIQEASRELTVNEAAKLEELAEDMKFESKEQFKNKLKSLKESYFRSSNNQDSNVAGGTGRDEGPEPLEEGQNHQTGAVDSDIASLNEQVNKMFGRTRF